MSEPAHPLRGADLLARALKARGVDHVFALSGNQIMPVFDAFLSAGITVTHTRHEAACVYMAEGYAQMSGRVGVALVTAGAGLGNAVGALISARASDTPVLLLSGDSPLTQDGRGAFQELDQCAITAPVTKLSERLATAAGMGLEVARAMDLAQADRPGPIHLALPADILLETVKTAPHLPDATRPKAAPNAVLNLIRDRLHAANAPLILLGPALNETRTGDLAATLAATFTAQVRCMESPRGLNDPSQPGLAALLAGADHVLSLGKQVDFTTKFGGGTAVWDVVLGDADGLQAAQSNLGARLGEAVKASPLAVAQALATPLTGTSRATEQIQPALPTQADPQRLTSATFASALRQACTAHVVTLIDGGEIGQWAQAGLPTQPRMINGPSGAIGGMLPAAIGAAYARPGNRILAVMGDGTVGFHLSELETLAREGLPVTIVIGNDRRWNAEHHIQVRDYGADRAFACDLSDADYAATARALGVNAKRVDTLDAFERALREMLDSDGPNLLDARIAGLPAPTY